MSYAEFLAKKDRLDQPSGFDPGDAMNPKLFPFQRAIVRWACRRGRAAVWADCGLGKTLIGIELKESYYGQMKSNLATAGLDQTPLFSEEAEEPLEIEA